MNALEPLFARLARSTFRSRFRLGVKERQYCWDKGAEVIDKHAADFIAQHATATCCRGCLAKWHHIPQGEALSEAQQQYIVSVIHYWLVIQMNQR
ncbi:DUF4186 family protein [Salmonella enterica]|nr:DUF4186 family protein [Salmonella enterica]EDV3837121.1 DUF4186 family protein [Salmonella enterica subsp. diarizonae]EEL3821743.1 DUF4186 family protein [Salmonella enterica]EIB6554503.1 DUF4186 family protein [Salmonella enterica]HAU2696280.1 DUF4186 family protein [Salmonella enterica subsp. diarizonae]